MDLPCRAPCLDEDGRTGTSNNGWAPDSPCTLCVCLHVGADEGVGFAETGVDKPEFEPKEFDIMRAGHEAIDSPTATEHSPGESL